MTSTLESTREPNAVAGWAVDCVCSIILAFMLNVVLVIGIAVYAIGRSQTVRIPGLVEVVVDERGFEAGTHAGVLVSFLVLATMALLVARVIRNARERKAIPSS